MSRSTINTVIASDNVFTSELVVVAHKHVNVCLWIGSMISYASVVLSTASATFTLQRQLPGDPVDVWREVDSWAVAVADAQDGNIEAISDKPEPETCVYRFGVKTGDYQSGTVYARLGTM